MLESAVSAIIIIHSKQNDNNPALYILGLLTWMSAYYARLPWTLVWAHCLQCILLLQTWTIESTRSIGTKGFRQWAWGRTVRKELHEDSNCESPACSPRAMQSHSKRAHSWQSSPTLMPENILLFQNSNCMFKSLIVLSFQISWPWVLTIT